MLYFAVPLELIVTTYFLFILQSLVICRRIMCKRAWTWIMSFIVLTCITQTFNAYQTVFIHILKGLHIFMYNYWNNSTKCFLNASKFNLFIGSFKTRFCDNSKKDWVAWPTMSCFCFFEVVVQTQIHCLTNAGVYLRTRNEERDKLVELRTYTSFFQPNLKRVASDVRKNVVY